MGWDGAWRLGLLGQSWEEKFLMALFLKVICSSWRIWCWVLLKFLGETFFVEAFLEWGFGVWSLELFCPWEVLRAIFTGCNDVTLEREGKFRVDAGATCLPSGSNWGEGMGMVDLVLVGGVFWLRCNSLVVSVWKYVRDGLIGKAESDMWVTKTLEFAQAKLKKNWVKVTAPF